MIQTSSTTFTIVLAALSKCLPALILSFAFVYNAYAVDIVKMEAPHSEFDTRFIYKNEVIKRALDITIPSYGPYELQTIDIQFSRPRALRALVEGDPINLRIALVDENWHDKVIPIKIPLRMGILSYRILLTHEDTLEKFTPINTAEDLKTLSIGLQDDWVINDLFKQSGHTVVNSPSFDGIFLMLQHRRFDYIPRGIHEIYDEITTRSEVLDSLVAEPTLALFLRVATYAYISPAHPRLAKRLESGLREMIKTGELLSILKKHFSDEIKKADLANRKVITLENPFFTDKSVINDKSLWFSPLEAATTK